MIHVRTLGGLDIRDGEDDRRLRSILSQPKRAALLVYLLVARPAGPVPRSRLLGLFWADSSEDRARNALNQALHVLRRGLGPGVIESGPGGDLRVDPDAVSCDALRFRTALDEGRLEEGLSLYQGAFLEGFEVSRSGGFERWRETERRRLRERAVRGARVLAERRLAGDNPVDAVHWARCAVRWSPFDETGLRELMRLLAELDDRAGALREYEAFRRRLERELDARPSDATRALAAELRSDRSTTETRDRDEAPPPGTTVSGPDDAGGGGRETGRVEPHRPREAASVRKGPAPPSRRTLVAAAAGVAMLAAVAVLLRATRSATGAPDLDERAVLAAPLLNETGDTSLDPLGWIAADWIAKGLMETEIVRGVPGFEVAADVRLLTSEGRDASEIRFAIDLARRAGAGLAVAGSFYRFGDSLHFRTRLVDASRGTTIRALPGVTVTSSAPLEGVAELRRRVVGALATAVDPNLASWSHRASPPPSIEAYEAYAAGFEHFVDMEFEAAADSFLSASRHSPAFVTPRIWAFWAYRNSGRHTYADSLIRELATRRTELGTFDRALLDYALAAADYDWERAYRRADTLLELAPSSVWRFKRGVSALLSGRRDEGIAILEGLSRGTGWLHTWGMHARYLALGYHWAGRHEEEHARALEMRSPRESSRSFAVARALAAMGRTRDLRPMVERIVEEGRRTGGRRARIAVSQASQIADELEAHGHRPAADSLRHYLASAAPKVDEASWYWPAYRSGQLLWAGEADSAVAGLDGLGGGVPVTRVAVASLRGHALVAAGDTAAARRELQALEALPAEERGPDHWYDYYRAGLTGALGDRDRAICLLEQSRGDLTDWGTAGAVHWHMTLHRDPRFRALRGDPAFESIVAATGSIREGRVTDCDTKVVAGLDR